MYECMTTLTVMTTLPPLPHLSTLKPPFEKMWRNGQDERATTAKESNTPTSESQEAAGCGGWLGKPSSG